MIRFHFNERKAAHAAATVLRQAGGRLSYMVLIKLLYLADRECLKEIGATITGDRYVSMNHGPVLSQVLDLITEGPRPDAPSPWFQYISAPDSYDVQLANDVSDAELDELSDYEAALLKDAWDSYGKIPKWDLVDILHRSLPEWTDPQGSAKPIKPEDMLRATGKSEDEIREIESDQAAAALDVLLRR